MTDRSYSLAELAAAVGGRVVGDATTIVTGLGALDDAKAGDLSHLSDSAFRPALAATKATAVLLREADAAACGVACIVVDNPYLAFAKVSQKFSNVPLPEIGVHERAWVDPSAQLGAGVRIGPGAFVGAGTVLGDRVVLFANAVVGAGCDLGADVWVHANATLYHDVAAGAGCVIHANAVIGADGFGFAPDERGRFEPIAQLGGVRLGQAVSVGAATTIDRGTINHTVIADGVKIDNQCQIGHNCTIGEHTIICGCVGIVGSTKIGKHCVLAGGSGVGGDKHVEICDGVTITATSHVTRSIDKPGTYSSGTLYSDHATWKRNAVRFGDLDKLARRVLRLEKRAKSSD